LDGRPGHVPLRRAVLVIGAIQPWRRHSCLPCRNSSRHNPCRQPTSNPVDYLLPMKKEHYQNRIELLQGTLDMLILQTLRWGAQHGYGIAQAIRAGSSEVLQVETGSLYPALHRLERQGWVKETTGRRTGPLEPDERGDRRLDESAQDRGLK
jgi:hypothetical protein